jgi:hypothetical protein
VAETISDKAWSVIKPTGHLVYIPSIRKMQHVILDTTSDPQGFSIPHSA